MVNDVPDMADKPQHHLLLAVLTVLNDATCSFITY